MPKGHNSKTTAPSSAPATKKINKQEIKRTDWLNWDLMGNTREIIQHRIFLIDDCIKKDGQLLSPAEEKNLQGRVRSNNDKQELGTLKVQVDASKQLAQHLLIRQKEHYRHAEAYIPGSKGFEHKDKEKDVLLEEVGKISTEAEKHPEAWYQYKQAAYIEKLADTLQGMKSLNKKEQQGLQGIIGELSSFLQRGTNYKVEYRNGKSLFPSEEMLKNISSKARVFQENVYKRQLGIMGRMTGRKIEGPLLEEYTPSYSDKAQFYSSVSHIIKAHLTTNTAIEKAREERERKQQETKHRWAEEERRKQEEERKRQEEEHRKAEEARQKAEEERKKQEEERRLQEEEKRRLIEEKKQLEEKNRKLAEEKTAREASDKEKARKLRALKKDSVEEVKGIGIEEIMKKCPFQDEGQRAFYMHMHLSWLNLLGVSQHYANETITPSRLGKIAGTIIGSVALPGIGSAAGGSIGAVADQTYTLYKKHRQQKAKNIIGYFQNLGKGITLHSEQGNLLDGIISPVIQRLAEQHEALLPQLTSKGVTILADALLGKMTHAIADQTYSLALDTMPEEQLVDAVFRGKPLVQLSNTTLPTYQEEGKYKVEGALDRSPLRVVKKGHRGKEEEHKSVLVYRHNAVAKEERTKIKEAGEGGKKAKYPPMKTTALHAILGGYDISSEVAVDPKPKQFIYEYVDAIRKRLSIYEKVAALEIDDMEIGSKMMEKEDLQKALGLVGEDEIGVAGEILDILINKGAKVGIGQIKARAEEVLRFFAGKNKDITGEIYKSGLTLAYMYRDQIRQLDGGGRNNSVTLFARTAVEATMNHALSGKLQKDAVQAVFTGGGVLKPYQNMVLAAVSGRGNYTSYFNKVVFKGKTVHPLQVLKQPALQVMGYTEEEKGGIYEKQGEAGSKEYGVIRVPRWLMGHKLKEGYRPIGQDVSPEQRIMAALQGYMPQAEKQVKLGAYDENTMREAARRLTRVYEKRIGVLEPKSVGVFIEDMMPRWAGWMKKYPKAEGTLADKIVQGVMEYKEESKLLKIGRSGRPLQLRKEYIAKGKVENWTTGHNAYTNARKDKYGGEKGALQPDFRQKENAREGNVQKTGVASFVLMAMGEVMEADVMEIFGLAGGVGADLASAADIIGESGLILGGTVIGVKILDTVKEKYGDKIAEKLKKASGLEKAKEKERGLEQEKVQEKEKSHEGERGEDKIQDKDGLNASWQHRIRPDHTPGQMGHRDVGRGM